jgi:hypothetical protein
LYVTWDEALRMRAFARGDRAEVLLRLATTALSAGPWSVTYSTPKLNVGAGPNDYVSQAPYWWPDPKSPGGPYIRRDGEHFPGRFTAHRRHLEETCAAALALAMGACFLGLAGCAERAARVISVWFLDPKTRMNPHLEYGEVIVGVNRGRGAGIIATQHLMQAAQGVMLLEGAGRMDPAVGAGLRGWCAEYLRWLTTSRHGLSEKTAGNNHSTWWTSQVATLASFTGNAALRRMAWDHARDFLVPQEIRADGSCPREEERTRGLHYSCMNLDAFALLCRLAQADGVDLWHFRAPNGAGVEKAFAYLAPFVARPETWRLKQITDFNPGIYYFPGLAGIGLPSRELLAVYRNLPRAKTAWVQFIDLLIRSA